MDAGQSNALRVMCSHQTESYEAPASTERAPPALPILQSSSSAATSQDHGIICLGKDL